MNRVRLDLLNQQNGAARFDGVAGSFKSFQLHTFDVELDEIDTGKVEVVQGQGPDLCRVFILVPHRALPDLQRMKLFAILRPRRRHRGRYSLGANKPVS
jgi:hypothetical protein